MKKTIFRKFGLLLGLGTMLVLATYCSREDAQSGGEEAAPKEEAVIELKEYFGEYYGYIWRARNWYWNRMGWGETISDENTRNVHYIVPRGKYHREGCTAGPHHRDQNVLSQRNFSVEAGPIWNNGHSQRRCPAVCAMTNSRWTGHWWTTVWNRMSVCQCRAEQDRLSLRVYSTSVSDYPRLANGNEEITLTPDGVFNAASAVFLDSKLKAPYELRFEYKMEDEDAGSVWNTADGISIMIGKDASAYNSQDVPTGSDRAFIKDGSGYGVHFELYGSRKVSIRDGRGKVLASVQAPSIFRNGEWRSVKLSVSKTGIGVNLGGRKLLYRSGLSVGEGYLGFGAATGAADGANHIRKISLKDWEERTACAQPSSVNEIVSQEDQGDSLFERLGSIYADIVESLRDSLEREGQSAPLIASTDEDGAVIQVSSNPRPAFLQALHAPSSGAKVACSEEQSQIGFRELKSDAYVVEAGPIWNIADGEAKCPSVCQGDDSESTWTGHWWTTEWNKMSVCMCQREMIRKRDYTVEAGPIWNNTHAQKRCPAVCPSVRGEWTGHWWTTVWGSMSVCQCREEENQSSFQGFSAGFTGSTSYPKRVSGSEVELIPDPSGTSVDTDRASVAFFDMKMQAPYTLEFEYRIRRTGTSSDPRGGLVVLLSKDASSYLTQSLPAGVQRGFINDGSGYGVHFDVYSEVTGFEAEKPKGIYLKDGNGGKISFLSDVSVANLDEWQKVTIRVTENSIEVEKGDERLSVSDGISISGESYVGIAASSNTGSGDEYRIRNLSVNACR